MDDAIENFDNDINFSRLFQNNNEFHELVGGHSKSVYKAKFTHNSKYLLSCGADGLACLWDVEKELLSNSNVIRHKNICSPLVSTYSGHQYSIWDIDVFSNLNLFVTASQDKTARLWSFDRLYPLRVYASHYSDVDCVAFHPNGAYIATGSSDKTIRFWSVHSGDCLRLFSLHSGKILSICFSPDGQYLASAGDDKIIKIWDIKTGKQLKDLIGHTNTIHALHFDNSSSVLCSGGMDKTVKIWDFNNSYSPKDNDKLVEKSNELIHSINYNFNIHSIYCDFQNVFYTMGANPNPLIPVKKENLIIDNKKIANKNIEQNENNLNKTPTKKKVQELFNGDSLEALLQNNQSNVFSECCEMSNSEKEIIFSDVLIIILEILNIMV